MNKLFRDLSIHAKLTSMTALAITATLGVACAVLVVVDIRRTRAMNIAQLESVGRVLGTNSTAAIAFGQATAADELLESLQSRPTVEAACLVTGDSRLFASYTKDGSPFQFDPAMGQPGFRYTADGFLEVVVPIEDEGEFLGVVFLRESTLQLQESIRAHLTATLLVLLVSLVFGISISYPLQRIVSNPLLKLADALRASGRGDYSVRVSHDSQDEIGTLYREFNLMLTRIGLHEAEIQKSQQLLRSLNQELEERVSSRTTELKKANSELHLRMLEKDRATEELRQMQAKLMETSRKAGMADIANGVLHNVGNVLNSLNVSANLIRDRIRGSKVPQVRKSVELIDSHSDDLATFFTQSEKGKILPGYLMRLAASIEAERQSVLAEMESLTTDVEHIKDIVRAQQSHAGAFGIIQALRVQPLLDEATKFVSDSLERHGVELIRDYQWDGVVELEKTKVTQILVNLIKNAKEAVLDKNASGRRITLRIQDEGEKVAFVVSDMGHGIKHDDATAIFSQGFTTKPDGHGFGLHASANTAREMGGSLSAHSDGPGKGATFTLRVPKVLASRGSANATNDRPVIPATGGPLTTPSPNAPST